MEVTGPNDTKCELVGNKLVVPSSAAKFYGIEDKRRQYMVLRSALHIKRQGFEGGVSQDNLCYDVLHTMSEDEILDKLQEIWLDLSEEDRQFTVDHPYQNFYYQCGNCKGWQINMFDPNRVQKMADHFKSCCRYRNEVPDIVIITSEKEE